jgi:hypothetical protein
MSEECCGECRFYKPDSPIRSTGSCRRYPPAVFRVDSLAGLYKTTEFPIMLHDGWCGEFKDITVAKEIPGDLP